MALEFTKICATTIKVWTLFWLVLCALTVYGVCGNCTFPNGLRGSWEDPEKGELTFGNDTVSGYAIHTFGTFDLTCYLQNVSVYIMQSTSFIYFGMNFTAYACWSLVSVSRRRFYLYELSDVNQQAGQEKVKMYLSVTPFTFDDVCSNTVTNTSTYRILRKIRERSQGRDGGSTVVVVVVLAVLIGLIVAVVVTVIVIRRNRSRGNFQIDVKSAICRNDRNNVYRVNDDTNTPSTHPPSASHWPVNGLHAERPVDVGPAHYTERPVDVQPVQQRERSVDVKPVHSTERPVDVKPAHNTERPVDVKPAHNTERQVDAQTAHKTERTVDAQGQEAQPTASQKNTTSPPSPQKDVPATPILSHGPKPTERTKNPMPLVSASEDMMDCGTSQDHHFTPVHFSASQSVAEERLEGGSGPTTGPG